MVSHDQRLAYINGYARAQVTLEAILQGADIEAPEQILQLETQTDNPQRHLVMAGFVNCLVREIVVLCKQNVQLRLELNRLKGAEDDGE